MLDATGAGFTTIVATDGLVAASAAGVLKSSFGCAKNAL